MEYRYYRGKTNEDEWIYGSLIAIDDSYGTFYYIITKDGKAKKQVDITSVGQYTSFKDKNKVEIFEGDTVKATYFTNRSFPVEGEVIFYNGEYIVDNYFEGFALRSLEGIVVTGNKYDERME